MPISEKRIYLPEFIKMVITQLVVNIISWNLHHCTQHIQSYLSMLKTLYWWKFPNGPFSWSRSLLYIKENVFKLLAELDCSKSTRPDDISARKLKTTATNITSSLTWLFNLSLTTGCFPDAWKLARVASTDFSIIQCDISSISLWIRDNVLFLQPAKCHASA